MMTGHSWNHITFSKLILARHRLTGAAFLHSLKYNNMLTGYWNSRVYSIVGYPQLHYSAMLRYVLWDNRLEKSRSHE